MKVAEIVSGWVGSIHWISDTESLGQFSWRIAWSASMSSLQAWQNTITNKTVRLQIETLCKFDEHDIFMCFQKQQNIEDNEVFDCEKKQNKYKPLFK